MSRQEMLELALKCKHNGGDEEFLNQFFADNEEEIIAYQEDSMIEVPSGTIEFIWYWQWLIMKKIEGKDVI